jgi:hypothetical protein
MPGIFFQRLENLSIDGIGDSIKLFVRITGAHDKKIGNSVFNFTEVHNNNVSRFFLLHTLHNNVTQSF